MTTVPASLAGKDDQIWSTQTSGPAARPSQDDNHNYITPEASDDDDDPKEYVSGFKLAFIVASVTMACFLMLVDTMVISTALPRITDEFNSLADVGWYASAYQFGSAAPMPLTGKVYTYFSTKWSFLTFFAIFELGSVLCGAAVDSTMLIVGRAVAGLGAAGIINGGLTIISGCSPVEKRPNLIGLTMGINQLGLVIGPLIGGAFTSYITWRWCFYINLPLGALTAFVIVVSRIPEQTPKPRPAIILAKLPYHLDLLGFALFSGAILQLLLALMYGGVTFAWDSSQVIGLFCGAGASFIVWFSWNRRRGDGALLPWSMLATTSVWSGGIYQGCLMAAVYGSTYFLPIYFQTVNNASAMLSGVYLLPTILPQLLCAGLSGPVLMKVGYAIPLALFASTLLSIASGLYSTLGPDSPTGHWVGFQIIAGVGSGTGMQMAIMAVQKAVTGEQLSSAMAFLVFSQSLAPAIVLALCQLIFVESLKQQIPIQAPGANATAIIQAGATHFRGVIDADQLPGVLAAYAGSISRVYYLVAPVAALGVISLWGLGWQDMRRKDNESSRNDAEAKPEQVDS